MTTLGQTASKADVHSEMAAYAEHINNQLKGDPALARHLPVDGFNLISSTTDGILLAKLVDSIRPGSVAVSKLNHGVDVAQLQAKEPGSKDVFKITENQNIFLEGVSKLGCKVVNVGAQDIMDGKEDLILGVVWQIIRAHLLAEINILSHPELIRLLRPDETIQTLLNLGSEQLLLRWFNYHLKRSGTPLQVSNFSEGIRDGQAYLILMQQIAPNLVDQSLVRAALEETNLDARAVALLEIAERLNCRKFVTAKDITQGHQRLNLAFTATLFNNHIGIQLPTEEEIAALFQRVESLSSQVKTLEEALQLATQKHQELSEASTTEILGLREQVADWEQKHEVATDKALHLQSSVDLLQSQNSAHEQQIADLKQAAQDQHKAFERICGDQSNVNEEIMRQLSQAHAQITHLEASLQEETAKVTQLSQRLQEQTSTAEVQLRRQQSLSTKTAKSQQDKLQAQLQQLVTLMKPEVDQAAWNTFQEASRAQSPTTEEDPTGQLLGVRWLVEQLIAQKKALGKRVAEQDGQLSRMRQMNDLMAEKVKEIAEELNQKKGTRK